MADHNTSTSSDQFNQLNLGLENQPPLDQQRRDPNRDTSRHDQMTADQEYARQLQQEENRIRQQTQRQLGPDDSQGHRIIKRLNVTICEAKLNKSYTLIPGVHRMDPYARCRIGHAVYSTHTHTNGDKNPIWDKQILGTLPVGVTEFFVEVFDEHSFTEDKRIGWCVVQLTDEVLKQKKTITNWFPLSGDLGENNEGSVKLVINMQEFRENVIVRGGALDPSDMSPAMANLPPAVNISRADVKQLREMFPNLDDETIRSILVSQGGNKEHAISTLLEMQ